MSSLRRRRFLQTGGAVVVTALTGCTAATDQPGTTSSPRTTEPTGDAPSPPEWTQTTDCGGEYDGRHESVVRVEQITASLDSGATSIQFSALSAGEQSILQSVTEDGGYATCDTSDAFDQFVDRIQQHRNDQSGNDNVYLEQEGTYYRLYVKALDQVYAH